MRRRETFRLYVKRAGYLSSANLWYLHGKLLDGVVRNGVVAVAETASGARYEIAIQNGAMVDPAPLEDRSLATLVIDEPPCPAEELEGAILIGAEETANDIFSAARTEKM